MATTQGDVVIAFEEYFHLRVIFNFCFIIIIFFLKMGFRELMEDPKENYKPLICSLISSICGALNRIPPTNLHDRIAHHSKGFIFRKNF